MYSIKFHLPKSKSQRRATRKDRRGLVLVAVLIVTVLLSLAAYSYLDWATTQYQGTSTLIREAQAKCAADSGVHWVMALLADIENSSTLLNGNPYDNMTAFQGIVVVPNDQARFNSKFTVLSPRENDSMGSYGPRRGLTDETGKINLNAFMAADPTGKSLYNALMLLPNMTDPIANSIVYWLDPNGTARSSGADNTYYTSLTPSYMATNGDLVTLDQLLLVQGVTPQLLYGDDLNRNGVMESNEQLTDPTGTFGRGWSDYMTIYSREPNLSSTGTARIFLNEDATTTDLPTQFSTLSDAVGGDMATFIMLARINGLQTNSTGTGATGGAGGGAGGAGGNNTQAGSLGGASLDLTTAKASNKINSVFDMINATVTVPGTGKGAKDTVYQSPLNDASELAALLPLLLDQTTTNQNTQLVGRINVNTATPAVLATLSGLQPTDVDMIVASQPVYTSTEAPDPIYQSVAWLMTRANLTATQMKRLEPYITAYSQVYRFQSVGYFEGGGPLVRLEVVVDLNPVANTTGTVTYYPRVLYYNQINVKLGPGWDMQNLPGQ
jgi:type II secretory pathway component PulK